MALRKKHKFRPKNKTVNVIYLNGGLGDHMGSLVATDYMIKNYKWCQFLVWVPDFLKELAQNVLPNKTQVRSFSEMPLKYNRDLPTKTTQWDGHFSPMKFHSVDYAFLKLCDECPSNEHKNYLKVKFDRVDISKFNLPEKYVVIATGYTAKVREFDPVTVNNLVNYVRSKGYTPVFLGQRQTFTGQEHIIKGVFNISIDYSRGLDLIDQTSLLQAAKIIQGAKAMVGVDCGLIHLAGCTDTAIVGGFTTVNPELRAPIRNNQLGWNFYPVVPNDDLECRFCQVSTNFLYDHDYKNCIYDDYLCVPQLTADKFIVHLEKLLT